MARKEYVDMLQQGAAEWNAWRVKHPKEEIDLHYAYLSEANLRGADLRGADLGFANLIDADLRGADLIDADLSGAYLSRAYLIDADLSGAQLGKVDLNGAYLSGANLSRTNLRGANLRNTDLGGANLSRTNLRDADLSRADLIDADLSGATTSQTIFNDLDLRPVKGLETIQHDGPSGITTSTLDRSEGDIPDLFLKGAGLSDSFITYARSLTQSPIQYYTCFLSYSSQDELFARRLHNDLQQEGVRCWFAPEDMDIGDKIRRRIDESIRVYDKLLLILSEHSLASTWVEYEVERALNKEPQGVPNVLYPVRVDHAVMTCSAEWAKEIKSDRHIGDFEHWTDPKQYQDNFKRLLRALNTKKDHLKK